MNSMVGNTDIIETLQGNLDNVEDIIGNIKSIQTLSGSINRDVEYVKKYKGEYNITPLAFRQQELETKNKLLEENVIVKEVPFFEVSNLEGTTIYIGSEV